MLLDEVIVYFTNPAKDFTFVQLTYLADNVYFLASLISHFILLIHFLMFANSRRQDTLRVVAVLLILNALSIVLKFLVGESRPATACMLGSHSYSLANPSQTACLVSGLMVTYFFNIVYFRVKYSYSLIVAIGVFWYFAVTSRVALGYNKAGQV